MKLYEIPPAMQAIQDRCEDGELTDDLVAEIANLELALKDKLDACACVIRNYQAKAAAYVEEAKRLAEKAQVASRNVDRMRAYMQLNLEQLGIDKIDCGLNQISLQNNPPSVLVDETVAIGKLEPEFQRVTLSVNKSALMQAHKAGRTLPPGITVVQTRGLRIR